mmetsp:Transcript_57420/g.116922  ORF Transcript_57420/g.116922 Transcript_57420/m.116922 type:complete len:245 (-) Transcript_57420:790-1524(-)
METVLRASHHHHPPWTAPPVPCTADPVVPEHRSMPGPPSAPMHRHNLKRDGPVPLSPNDVKLSEPPDPRWASLANLGPGLVDSHGSFLVSWDFWPYLLELMDLQSVASDPAPFAPSTSSSNPRAPVVFVTVLERCHRFSLRPEHQIPCHLSLLHWLDLSMLPIPPAKSRSLQPFPLAEVTPAFSRSMGSSPGVNSVDPSPAEFPRRCSPPSRADLQHPMGSGWRTECLPALTSNTRGIPIRPFS